jgi:zinc transporter ZupT
MLQSLLSAIVETLFEAIGYAILKFLGWENAAEFLTAIIGLSCIVIGLTMALTGHAP